MFGEPESDYGYNAEKRYTLILKDTLLSRDPETGREQATISWECDFDLPPQTVPGETKDRTVFIPWDSLNPTYRGKLKKDAEPLDLKKIKRFSIMMRRYVSLNSPLSTVSSNLQHHLAASSALRKAILASPSNRSKQPPTHRRLHTRKLSILTRVRSRRASRDSPLTSHQTVR